MSISSSTRGPGTQRSGSAKTPASKLLKASAKKPRNWTVIIASTVAVAVVGAIVGYGAYQVHENSLTWSQKADGISGIIDYRKTDPKSIAGRSHTDDPVVYKQSPPVGGNHNWDWQRCNGDIYPAQIANENAVHALEHGAVWITYNPSLPHKEVLELAAKVKGNDYMLMSPYPGLKSPISLQAWGFQLFVKSATDSRITQFIQDLRINATMEAGINCSSGTYVTATGTTPHDPNAAQRNQSTGAPATSPSGAATAPATPAPSASNS
jgi:hypothetical protein